MYFYIYHILGHIQWLMFVGVNFLVMFNAFGHIHSVILNRSSEYSSKYLMPKKWHFKWPKWHLSFMKWTLAVDKAAVSLFLLTVQLLVNSYLWGNCKNRGDSCTDTDLTLPFYNAFKIIYPFEFSITVYCLLEIWFM